MTCKKCGSKDTYEWAERVTLIGDFTTRLCASCENAFHEYIVAQPLWLEARQLRDRVNDMNMEFEITKQRPADADSVRARLHAIHDQYYAVSKAWVRGTAVETSETPARQTTTG